MEQMACHTQVSQYLSEIMPSSEVFKSSLKELLALASAEKGTSPIHESIEVTGREIGATSNIDGHQTLWRIPRKMQIWNTASFMDPFIQSELFGARHRQSKKKVDHRAYFAAYLARKVRQAKMTDEHPKSIHTSYFQYLPTSKDYQDHPILMDLEALEPIPSHSLAYQLMNWRQAEWVSEYHAFVEESKQFATEISLTDYLVARINISSRAFNGGKDPQILSVEEDEEVYGPVPSPADFQIFEHYLDYDPRRDGFQVLVPVLDGMNHHPSHNVDFDLDLTTRTFVVTSTKPIAVGQELLLNYGSRIDAWMYANYGFVNVDGSGPPGVSVAAFHRIQNKLLSIPCQKHEPEQFESYETNRRNQLIPYLELMAKEAHNDDFQKLKAEVLATITDDPSHWILSLPPREDSALLPTSSVVAELDKVPQYDYDKAVKSLGNEELGHLNAALSTCRLLALQPSDYQGDASDVLAEQLQASRDKNNSTSIFFHKGDACLEKRAHVCLSKLVEAVLAAGDITVSVELETLKKMITATDETPWSASQSAHVRLGEIQGLQLLKRYTQTFLESSGSLRSE